MGGSAELQNSRTGGIAVHRDCWTGGWLDQRHGQSRGMAGPKGIAGPVEWLDQRDSWTRGNDGARPEGIAGPQWDG